MKFIGNHGEFARRPYDADSEAVSGGMVIGRNHVVMGNTSVSCREVQGSHAVRRVTYAGNRGIDCFSGIGFRGRDVTMIGNDTGRLTDSSATGLNVGGATNMLYDEDESPNVGHVVLIGNRVNTPGRGVYISDDVESLTSDGNMIICGEDVTTSGGYHLRQRRLQNVNIGPGDTINVSARGANLPGIAIPNHNDTPNDTRILLDNIVIRAKIIGAYVGVVMPGADATAGQAADKILIDITAVDAEVAAVSLQPNSIDSNDRQGSFGSSVKVKGTLLGDYPATWLDQASNIVRFCDRQMVESSNPQTSHTGDTNETVLATIPIAANLVGANGTIEVKFMGTATASANNKTFRVRFGASGAGTGGTLVFERTNTDQSYVIKTTIRNVNDPDDQRAGPTTIAGYGNANSGTVVGNIDTTAATEIVITGQLANGGESINLRGYDVTITHHD